MLDYKCRAKFFVVGLACNRSLCVRAQGDFLYIFDLLEKKLHVPAADILIGRSYRVMEMDAMSEALLELLE